jgi:hypothetical protein
MPTKRCLYRKSRKTSWLAELVYERRENLRASKDSSKSPRRGGRSSADEQQTAGCASRRRLSGGIPFPPPAGGTNGRIQWLPIRRWPELETVGRKRAHLLFGGPTFVAVPRHPRYHTGRLPVQCLVALFLVVLTIHDLCFEPKYDEFRCRTVWSLSNALTSGSDQPTLEKGARPKCLGKYRSPAVVSRTAREPRIGAIHWSSLHL